eukprot:4806218-Prorocentrum_lima.AAC.1
MTSSLVGSEMCIRDRCKGGFMSACHGDGVFAEMVSCTMGGNRWNGQHSACLLYTSDAADDM